MKKTLLLALVALVLIGCNTQKFNATDLPTRQLVIGNGGGFTGVQTEYLLLENGQVFEKSSMTDTIKEINSISKKKAQFFFEQVESFQLDSMNFNHPGNMYKYVNLMNEKKEGRATWGDANFKVSTKVEGCYDDILTAIKDKN